MRKASLLTLVFCGCVTTSVWEKTEAERVSLEEQLALKNDALRKAESKNQRLLEQNKSLETALSEEKVKVEDLSNRIARAQAEMAMASRDKSKLQSNIEQMTAAIAELEKRRAEAEARVAEFKSLLARFKSLIDAGKLKVKIVEGRMVVVLATDILFGSGSANLSKDGKAAIAEVAQVLASIPRRTFQVEGHTDNVPIATAQFPSNWELASARAINVLKTMVDAGMPAERISAASFGDSHPVAANDSPEGKSSNRRIEITIVPDLSALPGFDELNKASN